MFRFIVAILISLFYGIGIAQDMIILRTGDIIEGKITHTSQSSITFEVKRGGLFHPKSQETISPADIYMVKYKDRGNLYFKPDGSRVSGENGKIDKSADVIYLCEGKEIPAWDITFNSDKVTYRVDKEVKKAQSSVSFSPISEIFMIKYSDGSTDIITDLGKYLVDNESNQNNGMVGKQFKVVFHTIISGDTLAKIAEKYGVSVEEIKEWNEMDKNTGPNTKLRIGNQLLIQLPI